MRIKICLASHLCAFFCRPILKKTYTGTIYSSIQSTKSHNMDKVLSPQSHSLGRFAADLLPHCLIVGISAYLQHHHSPSVTKSRDTTNRSVLIGWVWWSSTAAGLLYEMPPTGAVDWSLEAWWSTEVGDSQLQQTLKSHQLDTWQGIEMASRLMPAPESRDTTASSPDEADVPEHTSKLIFYRNSWTD